MVYSTQELYLKYKDYRTPHVKIQTEVKNGRLFPVVRGVYEDDGNASPYLLTSYIRPCSYISFEYVLSECGLIPERVFAVTAATVGKAHSSFIRTSFGDFFFRDVPVAAFRFGVQAREEGGYGYLVASPEKALCDLLSKKPPVRSVKSLYSLLFDDLRLDEGLFYSLDRSQLAELCGLYGKRNLFFLGKLIGGLR